jgi:hypothetical protein
MGETPMAATRHVLLEEEAWIRARWEKIALGKRHALISYGSPSAFLRDLGKGKFTASDRFFLDQDFGEERGVGARIARAVRAYHPTAYISLVTGYPKWMFRDELASALLDDIHGKFPAPFEDLAYQNYEDWYDARVWAPLREVYEGTSVRE